MSDDKKSIEEVLSSLIQEYGKSLYKKENANRLKSFLSDYCAGSFPKERTVLNVLIDGGIPERLLDIDSGSNDEKHHVAVSCCFYLKEDIGFTENRAMEAVNIIAAGLGWKEPLSLLVTEQSEQNENLYQNLATQDSENMDDFISTVQIQNHSLKNNIQLVLSPIAGTICRYLVKEGSDVSPDTKILTIECMKMELEIKAGCSGKVHFITPVDSKIKMNQTIATIHKDNQSLQKEYNKHEDLKIRKEEKNRENEKKQPRSLIQKVAFSPQPQQFTSSRSPLNTFNTQPITRKYSIFTNTAIILLLIFFSLFSFHQYQTDNSASPVGTYKLYSTTMDGNFSSKNLAKIHKKMGLSDGKDYYTGNLHLRQDGTGVMTFEGDSRTITWDSEKINVPGENEIYKYNLKDNKFTVFVTDDTTLVFESQKNRIWLIIGILLVISCLIYINLNTLHKFRNALIVFMVIIIGFVVIKQKDSAKKQLPESQQTTLQTKNQSSTTNSNKKNKTSVSQKTRKTTLEAEPGETFTVPKYVHRDLNVHEEKDLESRSLFTVSKDSIVYLSNKHKDGVIVKIKFDDNHIGWLNSTYLRDFKITSVQVGNNDNYGIWLTEPGHVLYASQIKHFGICFYADKIGNNNKVTFFIKIRKLDGSSQIWNKNISTKEHIFADKWTGEIKTGKIEIKTFFNMRSNFYIDNPGVWIIEMWYHDPKNNNEQNFTCIASTEFTLF